MADSIAWMTGRGPASTGRRPGRLSAPGCCRPPLWPTLPSWPAHPGLQGLEPPTHRSLGGGPGAPGPPQTRPGPSLAPSVAQGTLTVDIRALRATWAACALRPQIPRSPMSPGATVPIPVTLGKGLRRWREDRSSFQTPVTSRVPEAPPTGTWLQATLAQRRGDGLCKRPAGPQTRNRRRAGQSVSRVAPPSCQPSGGSELPLAWSAEAAAFKLSPERSCP